MEALDAAGPGPRVRHLVHGQTNIGRMLWKFHRIYKFHQIYPDRFTTSCPSHGITMWHRAIVDNSTFMGPVSMGRRRGGPFRGRPLRDARNHV
ncbi:MAG: hypothetical protein ACRDQU_18950 [Pseudonocardiaceae bacterium]